MHAGLLPLFSGLSLSTRGTHIRLSGCSLVGDGRQRGSCASSVPAIAWAVSEALLTDSREGSPWTMPRAFLGQLALSPVPTPDQNRSHPTSSVEGGGEQWVFMQSVPSRSLSKGCRTTKHQLICEVGETGFWTSRCLPVTCFPAAYVPLPVVWETQGKAVSFCFHALQRALR